MKSQNLYTSNTICNCPEMWVIDWKNGCNKCGKKKKRGGDGINRPYNIQKFNDERKRNKLSTQ